MYDGTTYPITFPTAFDNECSGVWPSIEHKTSVGGNEVFYHTNKSTAGFTLVADASHAPSTLDGVVYLAIGELSCNTKRKYAAFDIWIYKGIIIFKANSKI